MIDVFQALGTLPSRRDKLKSSIISINEFLKAFSSNKSMLRLGNGRFSCLDYLRHKSRTLMIDY
ncbi:hypothetical protein BpHYR1_052740 [Brachionus plicatilis]|uniref:Uncharacterized protein n=1 Tax=Brachionus plicatilis TaxID=10195 RepID=A0A3M7PWS5_BRAPC|nr:hypothetical protein BpHYR1_052740 [Brachionus plicatilis]